MATKRRSRPARPRVTRHVKALRARLAKAAQDVLRARFAFEERVQVAEATNTLQANLARNRAKLKLSNAFGRLRVARALYEQATGKPWHQSEIEPAETI